MNIYGHVGCAELLIQAGANVNFKSNHRNFLHYACVFDNVECVELLIKSGSDINVVDLNNRTPLHYSCKFGNVECIRKLLNHGADIEIKDCKGKTALDLCSRTNKGKAFIENYFSGKTTKSAY